MADLIQLRRDTAERWAEFNPVLAEGELGLVLGTANQYKVGDGVTPWNSLPLKGFNGNILDELGDNYDAVMSQGGLTNILKGIIPTTGTPKIDITNNFDGLDDFSQFSAIIGKTGWFVLTKDNFPAYLMLVSGDNINHSITQWLFSNLTIQDGQLLTSHRHSKAHISYRYYFNNEWSGWRYLHEGFFDNSLGTDRDNGETNIVSQKFFADTIHALNTLIQNTDVQIRSDLGYDINRLINQLTTLNNLVSAVSNRSDEIEDSVNDALDKADAAQETADTAIKHITMRFHTLVSEENAAEWYNIHHEAYNGTDWGLFNIIGILKNDDTVNFYLYPSQGQLYPAWGNGAHEAYQTVNFIEENGAVSGTTILPHYDKIYILDDDLYVYDMHHTFKKVGNDYQDAINVLNTKVGNITPIKGVINSTTNPTEDGIYLVRNVRGKIDSIRNYTNGSSTAITPSVGQIFVDNDVYYGWSGKIFSPIGGGSGGGSGSGNGFYNVTKEIPLEPGEYYTLESALAAMQSADAIDDEDKPGTIITIEIRAGEWEDYRFIGSNISTFYQMASWENYGGKGAVKNITLQVGTNTPSVNTPDRSGNVTLNVPAVEVDETIDNNSTNPVQNKAIAAQFSEMSGKYGTKLQLNRIEEGNDVGYSMSLLNDNDEVLDTSDVFTGGGGSGSVQATRVTLSRITPNPTVKFGDEVKLQFRYDQIDTETNESTGEAANVTITVTRGATSNSINMIVPAGSTETIDVTKFVGIGTNTVKVRAVVGSGETQQVSSISWSVSVVQLTLTSSFNIGTLFTKGDTITIPYALSGSGNKVLRCYVDGVDVEDREISSTSVNGSFQIPTTSMSHGAHSIQLVAELTLSNNNVIKSSSIYFGVAVRVIGVNTPIIATKFEYQDGTIITAGNVPYISVKQYENYSLTFAAYNPVETPTVVSVYELGSLISSSSIPFALTKLSFRAMSYGTENCKIVCGRTEFNFNLISTKSELDLTEPTDNMTMKLTAQGRSNNDTNKTEWNDEERGITASLSGFTWGGDGWTGTALRHSGNARTNVDFKLFKQPDININNAFAFMIKFRASEVSDYETPIISCIDSQGIGFEITPSEARIMTRGKSSIAMKMAADNTYEVGFVSFPEYVEGASDYERQNSRMLYLFIDGKMSGSVQRGDSDSVYQTNPQNILIGSDGATTDVYLMRAWNSFLTDNQMLALDILDQDNVDDLLNLYKENDILDDNGNISVDNVPDGMRVVIITGQQTNGQSTIQYAAVQNNKKTKYDVDEILTYVKGTQDVSQNFKLLGGCISLQGTSSLAYPIKNYRIYTSNKNGANGRLFIGCNEQGAGGALQSSPLFSFRRAQDNTSGYAGAPVGCWCLKADFAESSSSHNTGMARMVHDTLNSCNELTPAQAKVDRSQYNYDVRTTVDGEPCLMFYRATDQDTPVFLGKYNWNNDKSTEAVFGFCDIPGYHNAEWVQRKFGGANPTECWEFLNNDYPMGMFKDADFDRIDVSIEIDDGYEGVYDGVNNTTYTEIEEDGKAIAYDSNNVRIGEIVREYRWLKVFEARYPDDKNRNKGFENGDKPTYLKRLVEWVKSTDTMESGLTASQKAERARKFRDELGDYFDVDYLCDYYMFTDMFACVDQRVKNMMLGFWYNPDKDKMLAYMIFYDNDTILGVRNDGRLKYDWDINEDTIDPELSTPGNTVYAYAGHDSVLWKNLRDQCSTQLKNAYTRIRAALPNSTIFNYFDTEQSDKFCSRIFNADAINKYITPKTIGIDVLEDGNVTHKLYSYLEAMQGSRKAHRHYFVTNRMSLFDARYSTGNYTQTDINWKGNSAAGARVSAVAGREFYFEFKREGQSMNRTKVVDGQDWSYTYNEVANVGTIFHLYGGQWMRELNLADWGGFTDLQIPKLPILEILRLGKSGSSYSLSELVIGANLPMLKELYLINYVELPSLNLDKCTKLSYLDAGGCSKISEITFAESAPLEYFHIPSGYQTLKLKSLPLITRGGLQFDNILSISSLWIENCSLLDGFALFQELFNLAGRRPGSVGLQNVRITGQNGEGLELSGDGTDLWNWYQAGIGGLDASGNIIQNKCKIIGNYRLTSYMDDDKFQILNNYFDELNIRQPQYTMINSDDEVADDKNFSNPDNGTGYDYGNDYVTSGHIKKILNNRLGCMGKQTTEGEMTIYPLNSQNFNYFADGSTIGTSTPADLSTGADGDAFIYEPHYWYKGINDILGVHSNGRSKKYYAFSSLEDMPDVPTNFVRLTLEDLLPTRKQNAKIALGLPTIASSVTSDSAYSYFKIDVSGYKQVRFPSTIGPTVGAVMVGEDDSVIIEEYGLPSLNPRIVEGMYLVIKVPEGGKYLYFSVRNDTFRKYTPTDTETSAQFEVTDWSDVILSHSDKIEDMEPEWVEHVPCLCGMFEASSMGSKLYSLGQSTAVNNLTQSTFLAYARQRKMQLIDWEMHKDVANLFFAKYGRRNSQAQCGYGSSTTARRLGEAAFLGMTDTVNPEKSTASNAWYASDSGFIAIGTTVCMGYSNWFGNVTEWMSKVYLYSAMPYVYQITMPDGTIRCARSTSTNGQYVKYIRHEKYMDVISVTTSTEGTQNNYYADCQYISGGNQVVRRSGSSANAYGGVSYASADYGSTVASTYIGCRLAFRGVITFATSVAAYKALTARY